MNTRLILILLAVISLLSGCGTSAILDRSARAPENDESIVIFKASPANYRLMFFPGTIENGSFKQSLILGAAINGLPNNGYIVAKAKAGQTLGLTTVTETKDGSLFGGTQFKACGGARALVFEVPQSRVVYLTDIKYERIGSRVEIQYRRDLQGAITHIRSNYPEIDSDVQPLEFDILPTIGGCSGGTVVIPIYLGR